MLDYHTSVDMWSAGCVFAEMLRKKPLLPGLDTFEEIKLIVECLGTPDITHMEIPEATKEQIKNLPKRDGRIFDSLFAGLDISPSAIDLMKKMLTFDPTKRITAAEALEHPFFADVHSE